MNGFGFPSLSDAKAIFDPAQQTTGPEDAEDPESPFSLQARIKSNGGKSHPAKENLPLIGAYSCFDPKRTRFSNDSFRGRRVKSTLLR